MPRVNRHSLEMFSITVAIRRDRRGKHSHVTVMNILIAFIVQFPMEKGTRNRDNRDNEP